MMRPLTDEQRALVEANLPLVKFFLRKWRIPDHEWDDAEQDATVGLMRAAQLFDPERGYRFSTFAQWHILSGVQHGRGRLEGVNYRRAVDQRREGEYERPVSLDAPLGDDGDLDLAGMLVAPAEDEPDYALMDALLDRCVDDVDRRIVLAVAMGSTVSAAARGIGIRRSSAQWRLSRLRARTADLLAA